ncbi:MAG: cytochrome c5 family protein [Clostridia bacterium]|nr:cytochrome c5 family protein [Clostridia bacterium]
MKRLVLIMMVSAFALTLVNCGGSGGNETKSTTTTEQTEVKATMTADLQNGKVVYEKVCIACHMTGVAGAAKVTDHERWAEVAPKGMEALHQSVINGIPDGKYGVMAPRGSCTDCSDKDLYDAVAYILKEANVEAK